MRYDLECLDHRRIEFVDAVFRKIPKALWRISKSVLSKFGSNDSALASGHATPGRGNAIGLTFQ
jgi:hypothetical protein